ncbi:MAG: hypothetical protein KF702_11020 [Gammaproteobacteria bacterium]|nr:hypothetical protein [Gammaproteobacteria bacterium]
MKDKRNASWKNIVLMGDLSCSDAYAEGAFTYDDPNKQFITWEQFEEEVDGYVN